MSSVLSFPIDSFPFPPLGSHGKFFRNKQVFQNGKTGKDVLSLDWSYLSMGKKLNTAGHLEKSKKADGFPKYFSVNNAKTEFSKKKY